MAEDQHEPPLPELDAVTARLVRLYLERAAMRVERMNYSMVYMKAFKKAAQVVRNCKPE